MSQEKMVKMIQNVSIVTTIVVTVIWGLSLFQLIAVPLPFWQGLLLVTASTGVVVLFN